MAGSGRGAAGRRSSTPSSTSAASGRQSWSREETAKVSKSGSEGGRRSTPTWMHPEGRRPAAGPRDKLTGSAGRAYPHSKIVRHRAGCWRSGLRGAAASSASTWHTRQGRRACRSRGVPARSRRYASASTATS
eukprot:scaffold19775_cov33-Phaeocystis_antarctica.AAC.1